MNSLQQPKKKNHPIIKAIFVIAAIGIITNSCGKDEDTESAKEPKMTKEQKQQQKQNEEKDKAVKEAAERAEEVEDERIAEDIVMLNKIYNGTAKIHRDKEDKAFLVVFNDEGYLQNLVNHANAGNSVAYNMIQEEIEIAKNSSLVIRDNWKIRVCTRYGEWTGDYTYQFEVQNGKKLQNN